MLRLTRNTYQQGWMKPGRRKSRISYLSTAAGTKARRRLIQNGRSHWFSLSAQNRSQCVAGHRASQLDVNSGSSSRTVGARSVCFVNVYLETSFPSCAALDRQCRTGSYLITKSNRDGATFTFPSKRFAVEQWLKGSNFWLREPGGISTISCECS